jgi:serine/threonine protein kinase
MLKAKKNFSELEIRNWIKQISSALAYLEDRKVIHHDLKP